MPGGGQAVDECDLQTCRPEPQHALPATMAAAMKFCSHSVQRDIPCTSVPGWGNTMCACMRDSWQCRAHTQHHTGLLPHVICRMPTSSPAGQRQVSMPRHAPALTRVTLNNCRATPMAARRAAAGRRDLCIAASPPRRRASPAALSAPASPQTPPSEAVRLPPPNTQRRCVSHV